MDQPLASKTAAPPRTTLGWASPMMIGLHMIGTGVG